MSEEQRLTKNLDSSSMNQREKTEIHAIDESITKRLSHTW